MNETTVSQIVAAESKARVANKVALAGILSRYGAVATADSGCAPLSGRGHQLTKAKEPLSSVLASEASGHLIQRNACEMIVVEADKEAPDGS